MFKIISVLYNNPVSTVMVEGWHDSIIALGWKVVRP